MFMFQPGAGLDMEVILTLRLQPVWGRRW